MLVKTESIEKIRDYFGLNLYETKVWLALLSKGVVSAGDVAKISKVPRSRTYDILESLEKKGFAIAKLEKPVRYIGIKPKIILEKMQKDVKRQAEEKINYLSKVKEKKEFLELENIYKNNINPVKKESITMSLKGKATISNFVKNMFKKAKKEVIISTDVRDMKSKTKLFKKTIEELKKSNIKIKVALSGKEIDDKESVKKISKILESKIQISDINTKFFIVDRKEILFFITQKYSEESAIWINSDFFASSFAEIFEAGLKSIKIKN